jgi:hypothetical protein
MEILAKVNNTNSNSKNLKAIIKALKHFAKK